MDEAVEPIAERDHEHRCPICGGETELVSIGFVHRDGEQHQVEVSPKRRRCAVLDCHGHSGLDLERQSRQDVVQELDRGLLV